MKNVYNGVSGEFDFINTPSDASYVHTQSAAASIWNVNHNLNTRCSVQVVDDNKNQIIAQIDWIDDNNVQISFNIPVTGYVYCN